MKGHISFYWRLLLRRLPAMTVLFLICTAIGGVLAVRLPTIYASSARLLVEAPQISPTLAQSTVQISATQEIEIIRQQLLTRANLIDIARDLNVFDDPGMSPDEIVAQMRDATRISASNNRRGSQPTIVDVRFDARTGRIAANVVNEYVTRITAANVRNRTGAAENTMEFFEQEVARLDQELDNQSALISAFQRENAGALPNGQSYRLNRQSLLQERVATLERDIAGLEEQRTRLTELFEATGRLDGGGGAASRPPSREETRVTQLETQLEEALFVYSATNPRVVQLQARLDNAREALAASLAAGAPVDEEAEDTAADAQTALFDLQVAEIDARIEQLQARIPAAETELEELRAAIDETPLNEIALDGLQRDYNNIRQQYDGAVQRMSQASIGERIEVSARGQRITLVEAANVPNSPASPNRPAVAAAGVGAGLALAAGLFVLLELLNGAVRRPGDITQKLGIVPLSTIPYIETRAHRIWRRTGRVAMLLVVLVGVPAGLWAVDTYYLPLDLLTQRLLGKLGLA